MSSRSRKKLDAAALWDYALGALGRRALSAGELRVRLENRAADAADVAKTITKLKEYGYLNDERFAESFSQARLEREGFGRQRVIRDLRSRRVAPGVAERAAMKTYEGTDETALAEEFVARKYRSKNLREYLAEPKNLAAAYRRLRYAGFGSAVSIRVLKRYSEQADELAEE
jgi:regulatory protein